MKDIETTARFSRPKFKKISPGVNHYCITILPNHVATFCVLRCASWWRGTTPLLELYKILIRLRANLIRCNKQARNSCFVQHAWMSVQENIYPPAFTNKIDSTASVTLMNELFQHKNFQTRNGQIPWNKSSTYTQAKARALIRSAAKYL